jgi:hypothetical protein
VGCTATGVSGAGARPTYYDYARAPAALARERRPPSIDDVIAGGETWKIPEGSER